jgi:hypothetical protein
LFRTELHTLATIETRERRAVHVGGLSISLRDSCKEFYIPYTIFGAECGPDTNQ